MKRYKWYLILSFLLLLTGTFVFSQKETTIRFDRYNSENFKLVKGLSQNWVYSIMQDKYGYMWFGTWDGLNKFDGYNFTIFNVEDGLSDHTIMTMLEDKDGIIWIGTDKGLNRFDRETQTFTQYSDIPGDTTSLYRNRVLSLIQTKDGMLWLGTGGGLCRFDPQTETFTSFLSSPGEYDSPRSSYILHLLEDDKNNLWVATTYGLVIFDPKTGRSTRYYHISGDTTSLSNDNVRYIMQDRSGNFWIGTRSGLNYYDTTAKKLTKYFHDPKNPYSIPSDYIRVIYQERNGRIWVGTDRGGAAYWDPKIKGFIHFENDIEDNSSLSNDRIYSIYEDISGNLWIGTYKGVNKLNKYGNNFKVFRNTKNSPSDLNSNFIWNFAEDNDNHLWIGTSNGVNIQNLKTGKFSHLVNIPGNPNSLAGNEVRTMLFDPENNCFWLGLYGFGVNKYDLKSGDFRHYTPLPEKNSLVDDYISDLLKDSEGKIWIATSRGLNVLDPETNIFSLFTSNRDDTTTLTNNIVISLFEDDKNNIWAGTDRGLNKYNRKTMQFERYFTNTGSQIKSNTIFYITEDHAGKMWIGTSGGGLIRFNPEDGDYKTFTTADGLPNNLIYGILEDPNYNLWMSTNLGLVRFSVVSERFVNYDVKDGLQSYEFNLGSCYRDKSGQMYFGGMNGYNVFNPLDIQTNPNPPVIVISAFRKFNEVQPVELNNGDTIVLNHDDNFFSFEISALDYTNPQKNQYMYRLEYIDNDWVKTNANNRLAEYKKVRPGTYTFFANGSNNDGIWNESGISMTVMVRPPWYGTLLFRISFIAILVFSIWLIVYRRVKRIRRKHEVEKKLLEIEKQKFDLEQKALRLQMNPHFIFNSLNSIQSYIVSHDTETAVMYLSKFSQLMRSILANSGSKFVPFIDELKAINYYIDLEKLRFDNKFDFQIQLDKKIDTEFVEIPPMIVQPYVENAIIHGLLHKEGKGTLTLDFKLKGDKIICTVQDDGVGREQSRILREQAGIRRKSTGMHITQARLDMLTQESNEEYSVKVTDLKNDRGRATGTKVEIVIKYHED